MTNVEFRDLRSKAGLPQSRVAIRSGVDRTRLCLWENGDLVLRNEEVEALHEGLSGLIGEGAARMSKLATQLRR